MLTNGEVVHYLIGRGLISPRVAVEGEVVVRDLSRRNCNFAVECSQGPSYLVKQGLGPDGRAAIAHEAAVYRRLWAVPRLHPYLARQHDYEPRDRVLVLELLPQVLSLRGYYRRRGRFPVGKALAIADALGVLHTMNGEPPRLAPLQAPLPLRLHLPDLSVFHEVSGPGTELLQTLHRTQGLTDTLAGLQQDWAVGPFIHGDLRLDNFIVFRTAGSRQIGLKVVDWESAGPGDPCWDLGSVFAQYLSCWVASVPVSAWMPLRRAIELARYPLTSVRPSIQAFWRRYTEHATAQGHSLDAWLIRAVRMAAARLVQTALEEAQVTVRLTTTALLYVQLANNLLREPETAAEQLLQLRLSGAMDA